MTSLVEHLEALDIPGVGPVSGEGMSADDLSDQLLALEQVLGGAGINKSQKTCCERYLNGGRHLQRVGRGEQANIQELEVCLGKNRWQQIRNRVVTNALRTDLYFLPADGNDIDFSPIETHSLVLFRYPLTIPVSILNSAQELSLADWTTAVRSLCAHEPMAESCALFRPLKCLRLQNVFLADLLTKYASLYSRLGSPDFTSESVDAISSELGK
jgi:hypothetical protein